MHEVAVHRLQVGMRLQAGDEVGAHGDKRRRAAGRAVERIFPPLGDLDGLHQVALRHGEGLGVGAETHCERGIETRAARLVEASQNVQHLARKRGA